MRELKGKIMKKNKTDHVRGSQKWKKEGLCKKVIKKSRRWEALENSKKRRNNEIGTGRRK